MDQPVTARQLAREEMERRILASARQQLAEVGPAQISLRAVARDLGVASSAVYRYVASREDLITRLIMEVYGELGDAIEQASDSADQDGATQWHIWASTLRNWALAHPYDWALVYGTPIPGYTAPEDTVAPATRVNAPLLTAGVLSGSGLDPDLDLDPDDTTRAATAAAVAPFVAIVGATGGTITTETGLAMVAAWSSIHGFINLELGGHFVGVLEDTTPAFQALVRRTARDLGLPPSPAHHSLS